MCIVRILNWFSHIYICIHVESILETNIYKERKILKCNKVRTLSLSELLKCLDFIMFRFNSICFMKPSLLYNEFLYKRINFLGQKKNQWPIRKNSAKFFKRFIFLKAVAYGSVIRERSVYLTFSTFQSRFALNIFVFFGVNANIFFKYDFKNYSSLCVK